LHHAAGEKVHHGRVLGCWRTAGGHQRHGSGFAR
jgi:hypothetical protein